MARVPRVLIPSDNSDFAHYLARGYRRAGWEAVVGVANFDLAAASFDLVHLQWPEELCGWHPPSDERLSAILARLDAWNGSARTLLTVHNLTPHRDGAHPNYRRLYEGVIARVQAIAHFTEASRDLLLREYPAASGARQIVTGYFNLDCLLPPEPVAPRTPADAFTLLVFGGLREWAEVQLLRSGFDQARVPGKKLIVCARYDEPGPAWRQRLRRWTFARWLRTRRAEVHRRHIPDAQVHAIAARADAVVIPRFRSLNSGLPALGATFGKVIIAPKCGAYPELLAGTPNPLYAPGDAAALARAIEAAAAVDRAEIARINRALAERWNWEAMIRALLSITAAPTA